jgi:PIN domain nuclease of toxin-antitoxin system
MGEKILLDTCSFLWFVLDRPQLSDRARNLFSNPNNDIFLSVISAWEITVKNSAGRLPLPKPPSEFVPEWREKHGISILPLEEIAAVYESRLPRLHNDPFDRMLICQSIVHGLALLTPDHEINQYAVHTLW